MECDRCGYDALDCRTYKLEMAMFNKWTGHFNEPFRNVLLCPHCAEIIQDIIDNPPLKCRARAYDDQVYYEAMVEMYHDRR